MNYRSSTRRGADGSPPSVLVVGAGPVGCAVALLLADFGIPVTVLERHAQPHPLPRAVHLDDEVARTLGRIGVGDGFLASSRALSGLRLLDAAHRTMAEFGRQETGLHGFPQANMFHQPELEALLLARVADHPRITLRREVDVRGMDDRSAPLSDAAVRLRTRLADGTPKVFTGAFVLGCDGANSTVRDLAGITMQDLGFTERWLVIDMNAEGGLKTTSDCAEQICDPRRAATFMRVVGRRYRWEFQLKDGEDDATLTQPDVLGRLLEPWTGRSELAGLEIVRTATYTFRARLASRFRAGRVFLLGDAAHLTPPFIGQGLGAGLRDADNLAWKIAQVLTGQADEDLLATYDAERRPHARALIKKAVRIGWAMTGGQDRAAAVRRVALAAAVRSATMREALAATATPRLRHGALQSTASVESIRAGGNVRTGRLMPNPMVTVGEGAPTRLDSVLRGRTAVLTAGRPTAALIAQCQQQRLLLVRVCGSATSADPCDEKSGWVDVRLTAGPRPREFRALAGDPALTVLVRPDGVIAALRGGGEMPRLPWKAPVDRSADLGATVEHRSEALTGGSA